MLRPLSIFAARLVASTAFTGLGFGQRFDERQNVVTDSDLPVGPMARVDAIHLAVVPEPGFVAIFAFVLAVLGVGRVARLRDNA